MVSIGTPKTFGFFDDFEKRKQDRENGLTRGQAYLHTGRSPEIASGYHCPAGGGSDKVSARITQDPDQLIMQTSQDQQHMTVKMRWKGSWPGSSGKDSLVLSQTDTNPATGKAWEDGGAADPRPAGVEHRVEVEFPIQWSTETFNALNDQDMHLFGLDVPESEPGWCDGMADERVPVMERTLIDCGGESRVSIRQADPEKDGVFCEGYLVEVGDPDSADKYLIAGNSVQHLTPGPDRRVLPGQVRDYKILEEVAPYQAPPSKDTNLKAAPATVRAQDPTSQPQTYSSSLVTSALLMELPECQKFVF